MIATRKIMLSHVSPQKHVKLLSYSQKIKETLSKDKKEKE